MSAEPLRLVCVRRDIKLENAMLDARHNVLQLTDFGYSKSDMDTEPISNVGTPNYAGRAAFTLQLSRMQDSWPLSHCLELQRMAWQPIALLLDAGKCSGVNCSVKQVVNGLQCLQIQQI